MSGQDFTNGELGIMIQNLDQKVDSVIKQTTSTNGRVKALEMWRQFLLGAWAVLTIMTPIAWLLIYQSIKDFQTEVQQRIVDAIQTNNDKYFEK